MIFTSCEDVIDVDLNSTDPAFVAEAILHKDSTASVRLTYTSDYFSNEETVIVDNATITLKSDTETEVLTSLGNGFYEGNTIIGTEGVTYTMIIENEGITYTAESHMPMQTEIYTFEMLESDIGMKGDDLYYPHFTFKDTPNIDEYYMLRFVENGEMMDEDFATLSDFIADDGTIDLKYNRMMFDPDTEVEIQVFSIDEGIYEYFTQLADGSGGMNSSTPYNPQSNFDNNALGYFAAWSYVSASDSTPNESMY